MVAAGLLGAALGRVIAQRTGAVVGTAISIGANLVYAYLLTRSTAENLTQVQEFSAFKTASAISSFIGRRSL
jgi:hypothetical protein